MASLTEVSKPSFGSCLLTLLLSGKYSSYPISGLDAPCFCARCLGMTAPSYLIGKRRGSLGRPHIRVQSLVSNESNLTPPSFPDVTSQSEDHHPDTLKASLNPGPASRVPRLSGILRLPCLAQRVIHVRTVSNSASKLQPSPLSPFV